VADTISPTRMNLLQRQNQVKLAQQGVDLLKKKRDALVADFFNIVRRALAAREKLTKSAEQSYTLLGLTKAVEGRETLEAVALADPRRLEVGIETKNVWGTRIPTIATNDVRRSMLARNADPVSGSVTDSWVGFASSGALRLVGASIRIVASEFDVHSICTSSSSHRNEGVSRAYAK